MLKEKEIQLCKLEEEMRYYQLEFENIILPFFNFFWCDFWLLRFDQNKFRRGGAIGIIVKLCNQLELVNREQNYNSMFSSNPQVGLLDPLNNRSSKSGTSNSMSTLKNNSGIRIAQQRQAPRFSQSFENNCFINLKINLKIFDKFLINFW